jgi:hypothetical protein
MSRRRLSLLALATAVFAATPSARAGAADGRPARTLVHAGVLIDGVSDGVVHQE